MSVSRSRRFRVLARDGFACRYCGAKAPQAELQVDHIHPTSRGGDDGMGNLITACFDCNMGKRAWLMDSDLIALVAPPIEAAPPVRRRPSVREVVREIAQVLPWGLGSKGPYTGPDQMASTWRCRECGMTCSAEGDICSCAKPKFYCFECSARLDDEEGYGYGRCQECDVEWRREHYCSDCGVNERVGDGEYCEDCAESAAS